MIDLRKCFPEQQLLTTCSSCCSSNNRSSKSRSNSSSSSKSCGTTSSSRCYIGGSSNNSSSSSSSTKRSGTSSILSSSINNISIFVVVVDSLNRKCMYLCLYLLSIVSIVRCDSTSMTVRLDGRLLPKDSDASDVHFLSQENDCVAYDYDSFKIEMSTTYDRCGTTIKVCGH